MNANSFIEYGAAGFSTRNYLMNNATLTNVTQNISLYLLESASPEENLMLKIQDSALNPVKDYDVIMQRYYPGTGLFQQVESGRTDDLGQTIMHVIPQSIDYKFIILNPEGQAVYTTAQMKIVCYTSPCAVTLTIPATTINIFQYYQGVAGLQYNLSYNNNTKIVSLTWIDSTGSSPTMGLIVTDLNTSTVISACNLSNSTVSGTMICNLSSYTMGTFSAVASRIASPKITIDRLLITINELWKIMGKEAMFWSIMFMITMALVGIWNPAVAVGITMVGVVAMALLGFTMINLTIVIAVIILGGFVISQLKT